MDSALIAPGIATGDPELDALLARRRPGLIAPPRAGAPQASGAAQSLSPAPLAGAPRSGEPNAQPAAIAPQPAAAPDYLQRYQEWEGEKPAPAQPFAATLQSRAEKIRNPVLRALATVGAGGLRAADAAAGAMFPKAMSEVPGSALGTELRNAQSEGEWQNRGERIGNEAKLAAEAENARRDASVAQSENALRSAEQRQYDLVPITLPDGSQIEVQRKDQARMQEALAATAARQNETTQTNQTRKDIATQTNQARREVAASRPARAAGAKGARAMTPQQQQAAKAKAITAQQNAFRALTADATGGKIAAGSPQYVDREVAIQDAFAAQMRAAGQQPVITQEVAEAYKRKYGAGKPAMEAARAAGWDLGQGQ